jgi:hypothetical protein
MKGQRKSLQTLADKYPPSKPCDCESAGVTVCVRDGGLSKKQMRLCMPA